MTGTSGPLIEVMQPGDWHAVCAIYRQGIVTGQATFETETPTWEQWHAAHLPVGRLVARMEGEIVGWAALSPISNRAVYAGVSEVSVYVAEGRRGQRIGSALLRALVAASEAAGLWTLQASIFPQNEASVALHQACGFRIVGRRERVAKQYGVWRDVLLMERRSSME